MFDIPEKNAFKTVEEYIESQPKEVRDKLVELKACILLAVPSAVEMFNYGIPAFALVKGGGREEQIMMAGYKEHVGLYPHPTTMVHFEDELKEYKKGKGSVQFPLDQELPKKIIIEMIKYRKSLLDNR